MAWDYRVAQTRTLYGGFCVSMWNILGNILGNILIKLWKLIKFVYHRIIIGNGFVVCIRCVICSQCLIGHLMYHPETVD